MGTESNESEMDRILQRFGELDKKFDAGASSLQMQLNKQSIQLTRIETQLTKLAQIEEDMYGNSTVRGMITRMIQLENINFDDLITRNEFEPVKKAVYGALTLILSAVVIAIVSLVLKK